MAHEFKEEKECAAGSVWMGPAKCRVVLLGAGHTNTQVVSHLRRENVPAHIELVLVSDFTTSLYSGMCPGGIASVYSEKDFSVDAKELCAAIGWKWKQATVAKVDIDAKQLVADSGETIGFDVLLVDVGSTNVGLAKVTGVMEFAISTRPLKLLMSKMDARIEQLAVASEIHVVVVGGGVAGCELAMCSLARLRSALKTEASVRVSIVTSGVSVLSGEPTAFRHAMQRALTARGIEQLCGKRAVRVTASSVELSDGRSLPSELTLWCTGAAAHAIDYTSLQTDSGNFLKVDATLRSVSHPFVFGAGDCVAIDGCPKGFPPKAGVYAVRMGPVLVANLLRHLKDAATDEFDSYSPQTDFLRLANCGDGNGIGAKYTLSFAGAWVWQLKDWIDTEWMCKWEPSALKAKAELHFKPKTEDMELTVESAAAALCTVDSADDCRGFKTQWKALVRMSTDTEFQMAVIKRVKQLEESTGH